MNPIEQSHTAPDLHNEEAENPRHSLGERGLWVWWVVATSLGSFLGGDLGGDVGNLLGSALARSRGVQYWLVFGLAVGTAFGLITGIAQSLVLRNRLQSHGVSVASPFRPDHWILLTTAGAAVGAAVGWPVCYLSGYQRGGEVLHWSIFAIMGALAQWSVLRHHTPRAAWWFVVNLVSLNAAWATSVLFTPGQWLESMVVGGLLYAVLTATAIVWLLRGEPTAQQLVAGQPPRAEEAEHHATE